MSNVLDLPKRFSRQGVQERRDAARAICEPIVTGKRDRSIARMYARIKPGSDGCIHTILSPSTASGRMASAEDGVNEASSNLQNISKKIAKLDPLYAVRDVIVPAPGFVFLAADYRNAEALLVAAYSGDWSYYDKIMQGDDTHSEHAIHFFNLPKDADVKGNPETAILRDIAKTLTYASVYCASILTLTMTLNQLSDQTGKRFMQEEVADLHSILMELHPWQLWWDAVEEELKRNGGWLRNCFTPETRVLKADLSWVPIGSLNEGDELLAFDEESPYRWRISVVEALRESEDEVFEVFAGDGKFTATKDHLMLVYGARGGSHCKHWLSVGRLQQQGQTGRASHLCHVFDPWADDKNGWLGGFFDGEGYWHPKRHSGGSEIIIGQKRPVTLARLRRELHAMGVDFTEHLRDDGLVSARLLGSFEDHLQILAQLDSARVPYTLQQAATLPLLRTVPSPVISRESRGRQRIIEIATSTGTLVAEGFAAHNCFGYKRTFYDPEPSNRLKDGLSFYPQSTVASLMNRALPNVHEQIDETGEREVLHQIHDEMLFQCKLQHVDQVQEVTTREMERKFVVRGHEIYIPVEWSIGDSWGSMEELA